MYEEDEYKKLKSIAESFRNEIHRTSSVFDEVYLTLGEKKATKEDIALIIKMGIVYLMTYLEGFNREYFIQFFVDNPFVMSKELKNKKDQEKLKMSYSEIINPDDEWLLNQMAKKMYNEIFDYHRLSIKIFIKKFLDDYLELDFQNECQKRGIDILILQKYRDLRNAIVHYKELDIKEKDRISFSHCRDIILEYIILIEELTLNKYFLRTYDSPTLFDLDDDFNSKKH